MHRNLILVSLLALVVFAGATAHAADGFVSIFDGKTLTNWDGDPKHWRVEDGCLTGETTAEEPLKKGAGNAFCIWTGGEAGDFELTYEYRFCTKAGNSGVQYRSFRIPHDVNKWRVGGYQADCDSGNTFTGILYGEGFRGILGHRGNKSVIEPAPDAKGKVKINVVEKFADGKELAQFIKGIGEWNTYRVVAKGFHFTHEINGKLMVDVTDEDKDVRRDKGIIALQLHQGPPMKVQFRNIQLKRL